MKLQDKLNEQRRQFESSAPPEVLAVMHRATADLEKSGIMDNVLKTGDRAPEFSLPDVNGQSVNLTELLTRGPLVTIFYRGVW